MKKIILALALFSGAFCACSTSKTNSTKKVNGMTKVSYTILKHYFANNTIDNQEDKVYEFTSEDEFKKYIGSASVMGQNGTPTKVDFGKDFVLALVGPTSNQIVNYKPTNLMLAGGMLHFSYKKEVSSQTKTFTSKPVLLLSIDKKYYAKVMPMPED